METIAVIQLATSTRVPSAGPLSRAVAALLAGRLNRAPSLQASLVELRAAEAIEEAGPRPMMPGEADQRDRVVVNDLLDPGELREIARAFRARNWLTGRLDVDPDHHLLSFEVEMAPVMAGSGAHAALIPWRRAFRGDLDDVADLLNRATLAVAGQLGGALDTERLAATLPVETRSFDAFCHYCRALDAADPEEARDELEDACALDPWFIEALGELARGALRANDAPRFEEWATALLHAGHVRPRRLVEELTQISDAGFAEPALQYTLLAARLATSRDDLLDLVGEIGLRHGGDIARVALQRLDDDEVQSPHLLALRASLNRLLDDEAAAQTLSERALTTARLCGDDAHTRCLHDLGALALRIERLDLAADLLERALARDPRSSHIRGDLAAAWLRLGRFDDTARLLRHTHGDHVVLHSNLALALHQLGHLDEAVDAAQRAINADPGHPQAWGILGDLLRASGNLDDARAAFERAVSAQPDNLRWHLELGRVLFRQDRFREALAHFRLVLAHQPELAQLSPELLFVMAEMARARPDDAETLLKRAWELDPTLWQAANNLGVLLLSHERYEEAATWLSRAMELVPHNEGVRANLARALVALPHRH